MLETPFSSLLIYHPVGFFWIFREPSHPPHPVTGRSVIRVGVALRDNEAPAKQQTTSAPEYSRRSSSMVIKGSADLLLITPFVSRAIVDDDKKFAICLDVSQFRPEELNVHLEGRELTIKGKQEHKTESGAIHR
ncbi:hypothetical protein TELCIR_24586 [Teladorsagia circumcincta]|uniref:SHSP domain-containing protein n=1 Tax=Teladorsagia circumcincta TaxID=45464 RepID=A0A2G9T7X1_TELCI|nr:hypothetical protein TELCIR_24586 [Teladorsagia circumcincta]